MNLLRHLSIRTQIMCAAMIPLTLLGYFFVISNAFIAGIGIGISLIVSLWISIQLSNRLKYTETLIKQLDLNACRADIDISGNDEITSVLRGLKSVRDKLHESTEKNDSDFHDSHRIKQALDNVSANVMVADAELNIVYFNDTARDMFANAESDIRKDLPNFNTKNLLGTNIDNFHKNPEHQRGMLQKLSSTFKSELNVGGRTFTIIANPIIDENGERIGTVVEWEDRTAELAIEDEVQDLVEKALDGDLSRRISLDDKDGFLERLSQSINSLVDVSERVINDTLRILSAMSEGDLTQTIEADYHGSFNQLKNDANKTIDKFTEIARSIKEASALVNNGTSEISNGNIDLSRRTEAQAAALEETSASMEEMTSTVKQNAENAKEANELAINTSKQAQTGGEVVNNAVIAMREINEASSKISNIIGVIDEIAFQTNLLALNAAVEAARAGEQGRGFAVVATEVRNLAGRSASAAKEIKGLIEDSVNKVEEGSRLVNQSGETLEQIMESVKKVTNFVGDITSATQEQALGIEQVNKAVIEMDATTQQNTALVEEAAAAAESMSEQSQELDNLVSFFKIDDGENNSQKLPGSSEQYDQERRSENRPWSQQDKIRETEQPKKVSNGEDLEEWSEF